MIMFEGFMKHIVWTRPEFIIIESTIVVSRNSSSFLFGPKGVQHDTRDHQKRFYSELDDETMSSSIAGSAAVTIISPTLDLPNSSGHISSRNETRNCLLLLTSNREIVRRENMNAANNNQVHPQPWIEDRKVTINIRGTVFETFESTLARYPRTLLGCKHKRNRYYDRERNQYCFNRSKEAFDAILYYYQSSGKLIRPKGVDEDTFVEDLDFFEIDPWNVAELEYGPENFKKPKKKERRHDLEGSRREENDSSWNLSFGDCKMNTYARCCNVLISWPCVVIVIVYIFITCLSSLSGYQSVLPTSCADDCNGTQPVEPRDNPLLVVHFACSIWFLLEFILRLTMSLLKLRYLLSFSGAVDIITVVSAFLQILLRQVDVCQDVFLTWFANVTRLVSVVCIFKLSRYSTGLRLFGITLKACAGQLILSLYCVGICLLFFSAVIYHSEESVNQGFSSIVDAFWYTIITLTTVGYGDLIPTTIVGKVFGALCSVFGVAIVMAWPATIFVSYFTDIYNHKMGKRKKKKAGVFSRGMYKFKKGFVRWDRRGCMMR